MRHGCAESAFVQDAIEACYSILGTVQRLWRRVKTEDDDDYIAIPKPSGYQSLHTAVIGEETEFILAMGISRSKSLHLPCDCRHGSLLSRMVDAVCAALLFHPRHT